MQRLTILRAAVLSAVAFLGPALSAQTPQTLYYKFNEGAGTTTANDANPGAGTNPAPFSAVPPAWVSPGKLGASCISLAANQQGFLTGWSPNLTPTTPWTIEGWVRKNNTTQSYLCGAGTATTANFRIYQISTGLGFASMGGTLTATTFTVFQGWHLGNWNHFAAVYDPSVPQVRVYSNGVLDLTLNGTTNIVETAFTVGGRFPTDTLEWSGEIDDFRIWNVARTQTEIQANMNNELFNGPSMTVSAPTVALGNSVEGVAGNAANYTVSGNLLTAATTITAPAGVEISLAVASGYSSSIQIPAFPAYPATTIYARIMATAPVGPITGNISHASPGAPNKDVAVSGNTVSLHSSQSAMNLGMATIGGPGVPQSYDLTGAGLVAATTVTAPAGFELATSFGGPYTPTLNIATMPAYVQTIFVRQTGAAIGVFGGNVTNVSAPASVNVAVTGNVVPPDNLNAARFGPATAKLVDNFSAGAGGNGLVLLDFSLDTIMAAWTVTDLTFSASGAADEQADINFLALYEDSTTAGTPGLFDGPFVDTLATATAGVSFSGANGTYNAILANPSWPATTSRRFFLVCKLSGKAVAGETFKAELTVANGSTASAGMVTGVPTAAANDALAVNDAELTVFLNGPVVYSTLNNNAQGAGGNGVVVCDVSLLPKNDSWTVSSLTFSESGTIDGQADVSFLGLYLDNGNGIWDGPATDTLATATTGVNFNGANGSYTAGLTAAATAFSVNQSKRLFLVAKLGGTASSGETLRIVITGDVQNSPTGGSQIGVPTGATAGLVIDLPTLTLNAGPANPTTVTREKLAAGFVEMVGQFRFSASNSNFTVAGITLTTAGNGSWAASLDPTLGVQLFRDTGNGTFDAADILLCSVPGASPSVVCNFGANQTVTMNTDTDIWVVLNVLGTAGGSPAETFMASIASGAAVNSLTVGGTVKLGTLASVTGELRVVDFSVTEFKPTIGLLAGGQSVKIEGSGFALPVTVTIGGVPCTGVADVNDTGTQITGLITPPGTGVNLAIVLTTNNLPARTLTDTFTYSNVAQGQGTNSSSNSNSCSAEVAAPWVALITPAALALFGLRRRRCK